MRYEMSTSLHKKQCRDTLEFRRKKKLVDVESTSSSALGWIVLDLDIWVRFGFNYGIGLK